MLVPLKGMTDDLLEVITHIPTMKKVSIRTRDQEAFDSWKAKLEGKKPDSLINRR